MAKAYAYSRYSNATQGTGDSMRRQLKGCFDWADKHDLELDTTHRDTGVSGFTGLNRISGALGSFLVKVETGEIERGSYLLVDSLDRLSRENETRVLNMLTNLTLAGIKVVNVAEDHVLDERAGMVDYMRVLIHAARAHEESKEKARKVAAAHEDSKRKAREEGRVWHKTGPHWLKPVVTGEGRTRVITGWEKISEKVRVVERVFDLIEAGLGTTAIAERFNDDKEETPHNGNGWHHSTVLEIAKNRCVLGEYQPKFARKGDRASRRPADGEAIPGYYGKGIVEPDQFYRVQAIIKSRAPRSGRRANVREFNNVLIGIGRCYECGGRIGIHVGSREREAKWKRSDVLVCGNSRRGLCSNKRRYRYEELEVALLTNISEFEPPQPTKNQGKVRAALQAAIGQREDVAFRHANVMKLAEASGDIDFIRRKNELDADLKAMDKAIAKLRDEEKEAGAGVPYSDRQEALQRLSTQMAASVGEERYRLRAAISASLTTLVDWIDFDPNGDVRVILAGATVAYRFSLDAGLSGRFQRIVLPQPFAA